MIETGDLTLDEAMLSSVRVVSVVHRAADLRGVDLDRAILWEADFAGAVMPNGASVRNPDHDKSDEIASRYRADS
jgi:uncharacterized protein YjbI with pentapeptide repeats